MAAAVALEVPFHIDGAGRVAQTLDPGRQIELRLLSLINTSLTERVMRPNYGTRARIAVFDVNDPLAQTMLGGSIKDAITAWEPAVVVDSVDMQSQDPAGGEMICVVNYHFVSTGSTYTIAVSVGATVSYGWPTN